jgi:hypothetical protein
MADDDSFFYLGTTTGDILKMNPKTKLLADTGPVKDKFSLVSRNHQDMIQSSLSFSSAQSFVKEKPVEGGEVCKLAMDAKSHTPVSLATLHWPVLQALLSGSLQGKIGYVSS